MRAVRIALCAGARVGAEPEVLALALPRALEEDRELVLLADLPGDSSEHVADVLIQRTAYQFAVRRHDMLRYVADELVGRDVPRRHEEPQLVSPDRPAEGPVEILNVCDTV